MDNKDKNIYVKYKKLPILVIELYIGVTFLLYLFGPWEYEETQNIYLIIYIMCFLIISHFCYMLGGKYKLSIRNKCWSKKRGNVLKYIKVLLMISLVEKTILLISCIVQYGMLTLTNISTTMAQTYQRMYRGDFAGENVIRQLDGLLSWVYVISICGALFLWEKLNKSYKIIAVANIVLVLLYNLGYMGVQKTIFDNIIYISLAVILKILMKEKKKFSLKKVIVSFGIVIFAILVLANIMSARRKLNKIVFLGSNFDYNHFLIKFLPRSLQNGIGTLISYGTMGYYFLSKTFQLPFKWTYGLGSNWGINQLLTQLFGIKDFYSDTYVGRLETVTGIDGKANWLTIFPWLASDLTFIGALVVLGICAFILAKCWKEIFLEKNVLSYILLNRFAIGYFYILANNQLFITKGEAISTIVIFTLWFFVRGKWKCEN